MSNSTKDTSSISTHLSDNKHLSEDHSKRKFEELGIGELYSGSGEPSEEKLPKNQTRGGYLPLAQVQASSAYVEQEVESRLDILEAEWCRYEMCEPKLGSLDGFLLYEQINGIIAWDFLEYFKACERDQELERQNIQPGKFRQWQFDPHTLYRAVWHEILSYPESKSAYQEELFLHALPIARWAKKHEPNNELCAAFAVDMAYAHLGRRHVWEAFSACRPESWGWAEGRLLIKDPAHPYYHPLTQKGLEKIGQGDSPIMEAVRTGRILSPKLCAGDATNTTHYDIIRPPLMGVRLIAELLGNYDREGVRVLGIELGHSVAARVVIEYMRKVQVDTWSVAFDPQVVPESKEKHEVVILNLPQLTHLRAMAWFGDSVAMDPKVAAFFDSSLIDLGKMYQILGPRREIPPVKRLLTHLREWRPQEQRVHVPYYVDATCDRAGEVLVLMGDHNKLHHCARRLIEGRGDFEPLIVGGMDTVKKPIYLAYERNGRHWNPHGLPEHTERLLSIWRRKK